jgi:tetratricopeptide (TPR) repeat protein
MPEGESTPVTPLPSLAPPARAQQGTVMLLGFAIVASVLVVGGGIAAVLYATRADERARTDAERKALEKEREEFNAEKRKAEFAECMKNADIAMAKRDYAAAIVAYKAALKLVPDDSDASQGLIDANVAAKLDGKATADSAKRQTEYTKLMDEGKKAVASKAFADAIVAFEKAAQVKPGDDDANKNLNNARAALATLQSDKAKATDYQARMDAGRDAFKQQRYPDAVREFLAALRIVPNDDAATKALQEAEKKLGDVQDVAKRKADFDRLVDKSKSALRDKRFDESIDLIQAALKLFPGDMDAAALLADARQRRTDARNEYTRLVDKGAYALRAGQFEQAKSLFTEANRLFPDDAGAKNGLRDAQKAIDDATAFARYRDQGLLAFNGLNYDEALRNYNLALALNPNDAELLLQLRKLQKLMAKDVGDSVEFDRQMAIGKAALDRRAYADAVTAFKQAVHLSPGNLVAIESLHLAKYNLDIVSAKNAMSNRQYREAVRFYEDALLESPGDFVATTGLEQARLLAKSTEPFNRSGVKTTAPAKP